MITAVAWTTERLLVPVPRCDVPADVMISLLYKIFICCQASLGAPSALTANTDDEGTTSNSAVIAEAPHLVLLVATT